MRRLASQIFWRLPARFAIARFLGRAYSLRSVVFHNISATESPFTRGMGVSITPAALEAALRFLTRYYNPVRLQDVLDDPDGKRLPARAVLVTFDDGYASDLRFAAPLCRRFGVPAVFFINGAYLDNHRLAPDNLICYAYNVLGLEVINSAVRATKGSGAPELQSLAEVFSLFFPAISLVERESFLRALTDVAGIDQSRLAAEAGLYLSRRDVRDLAASGFEIGNHTYSHVHGRSLSARDLAGEIDKNNIELEQISAAPVRSFSVPYGSSRDLTESLFNHLKESGHKVIFLSESAANPDARPADATSVDRISIQTSEEDELFFEIEVMARLRTMRNRFGKIRSAWRGNPGLTDDTVPSYKSAKGVNCQ